MSDSSIHLDDTWLETFTRLRMTACGQTVIDIANDAALQNYSKHPSRQTLMLV